MKVRAVEAVNMAVKAMDVTAAMVEAEVEAVNEDCSGSDDGGSKRRQRDFLEGLLASLSRISSPGARPRVEPFSSAQADPSSSIEMLRWIVRRTEVPAKMTHTKMALVRRG